MMLMRVRSGRSGRRRGSQNPGTPAAASPRGCAIPGSASTIASNVVNPTSSAQPGIQPGCRPAFAPARSFDTLDNSCMRHDPRLPGPGAYNGNGRRGKRRDGATMASACRKRLEMGLSLPSRQKLQVLAEIGGGFGRSALEAEGRDEAAILAHQVHDGRVVHGVAILLRYLFHVA